MTKGNNKLSRLFILDFGRKINLFCKVWIVNTLQRVNVSSQYD